jgi:hypothetical protein
MVVSTGEVIADGAKGPGITVEQGRALLRTDLQRPGLEVEVGLRAAEAEVRDGSGGAEVVGGPACDDA